MSVPRLHVLLLISLGLSEDSAKIVVNMFDELNKENAHLKARLEAAEEVVLYTKQIQECDPPA